MAFCFNALEISDLIDSILDIGGIMYLKTTISILIFALTPFKSFAEVNSKMNLNVSLSRFGKSVCRTSQVVIGDQFYLLCEGTNSGNRIFLKASAKMESDKSIFISAVIEEVDSTGRLTNLSNPSIRTLLGQVAEISQSDDSGELLSLSVVPSLEN